MPHVVVAAEVDPVLITLLENDPRFELTYRPVESEDDLAALVAAADALVTRYHNRVTRKVIDAAPCLRLIVQGTSGLDNIDFAAAAARSVIVTGLPGENANAVAEMAIGLMISLTRTIPEYDRMMRTGGWQRSDCSRRREMRGYRLGIVGIGRVGSAVARLARSFGMQVSAYDPYVAAEEVAARGAAKLAAYDALLRESDIVTWHVPLTEETAGMISAGAIELLPEGAIVINTSRGGVGDVDALLQALAARRLGGVALDVFESEPPRGRIWPDDPRLIVTPHIAGCSREAKESIGREVYARIVSHFFGSDTVRASEAPSRRSP